MSRFSAYRRRPRTGVRRSPDGAPAAPAPLASGRALRRIAAGLLATLATVFAGASAASAARLPGAVARNGDRITAQITAGDEDAFAVDLSEGGSFVLKLKGTRTLKPNFRIFDPAGAEVPLDGLVRRIGTTGVNLKPLSPAAGLTGTWKLLVNGLDGTTGAYTTRFTVKHPASTKAADQAVPAGGTREIEFTADTNATVTATISEESGGPIGGAMVLTPDGDVAGSGGTFVRKGTKLTMDPLVVDGGFGRYKLVLTGGEADAVADVSINVKFRGVKKRRVTLPPEPTATAFAPAVVRQGDVDVAGSLTAAPLPAGTTFEYDDTLVARDVASPTPFSATFLLDVPDDTPYGSYVLRTCPPAESGEPAAIGTTVVKAPLPVVTSATPAFVRELDVGVLLDVTGTGFRPGGTLSVSGVGITVGETTVLSPTRAQATLSVSPGVATGLRDIVFTQPAEGGGDSGTLAGILEVRSPDPLLTSVSPVSIRQGDTGVSFTLTGQHFRDGGTVSVSGGGLTVSAPMSVTDTSVTVQLDADSTAAFGPRDVTYTHPAGSGGASVTLTSALAVNAPVPSVTSISPTSVRQGDTGVTLTVNGTGFASGGAISVSGSGLTLGSTTIVSATQATVSLDASSSATFGARDVTFTQAAAGGGDSSTATGALTVLAPAATITSVSPTTLRQGDAGLTLTVNGTGFRSGGAIGISGSGLTVGTTTFVSETQATVTVDVDGAAVFGSRDVTWTQPAAGGGDVTTSLGAVGVAAPVPTVTTISPTTVKQGDTSVTLTVNGTGFRSGGAISVSGSGFTLGSTTFVSATQATVTLDVDSAATFGARDVTWTQPASGGGASTTKTSALTVNAPTPTITTISPTTVKQGDTSVTLTVNGTNFRSGGAISISGSGFTLGSTTFVSATQATVTLDVDSAATFGDRDVTWTQPAAGGGATATKTSALTVNAPTPTITTISPTTVKQGDTSVTLTVNGTGFRSGGAISISGSGLTLGSTTFVSATQATVTLDVDSAATFGARDVTWTQPAAGGSATATKTSALTVNAPTPTITTVSPTTVKQGDTSVTLTVNGTNFRSGGAISVSGSGFTLGSTTFVSATQATVTLDVDSSATFGARDVTWTQPAAGGSETATKTSALTVTAPTPTITTISPTTVKQGDTSVTLTVNGTNFRSGGAISVSGSGFTLGSTTFVSATQATVTLDVDAAATFGARDVTWTQPASGGSATATKTSALTVTAPTPTITTISPTTVKQGDTSVTLTVNGTNFRSGGAISVSGSGFTLGSTTFVSATQATVTLDVDSAATFGARDVTWTQPAAGGSATATKTAALTVNAPTPTITSVSPTTLTQGATSVTFTVNGTNFRSGGAISISGTGLTVGSTTFVSATQATVTLDVDSAATFGARDVTWTQPAAGGGATATATSAVTVIAPTPTISSVSPTTLRQGASAVTFTVTGTNFRSGGAITISGAGLTLGSTTVSSATTATVSVTIDAAATYGARDVTFTQPAAGGGASATSTSAVTIAAPVPTVTSASPSTLKQGDGTTTVTVNGTGFRTGGAISISGTGLTVSGTTFVSATQATVTVAVASNATFGGRTVTWTQPAAGGGDTGSLASAITIAAPTPTVTSISPTTVKQLDSNVTFTLNGTNFRSGGAISFTGTGLTVGATTFVSETQATVTVSFASNATLGQLDATWTQPAAGGGAQATLTRAVTVNAPTPTVSSVSPTVLRQGDSSVTVTLNGTNFRSGGSISISGSGLTVGSTTFVSSSQATVVVSVDSAASYGARDVTWTQPLGSGGESATLTSAITVEAPTPTVTSVSPLTVKQSEFSAEEAQTTEITVTGTGFRDGGDLSISGKGITIAKVTVVSTTSVTAELTVDYDADFGARDVTWTQPAEGGGASATATSAFSIVAPDPVLFELVVGSQGQGETPVIRQSDDDLVVTIYGVNFRDGCTLDFGPDITVVSYTIIADDVIEAVVDVSNDAAVGLRDFTYTQPSAGGGAGTTLGDAFEVLAPIPAVDSVSPTSFKQGQTSQTLTVAGTGFRSGGTLSISGSGLTVGSTTFVSDTEATVTVSIADAAAIGTRDVTFTQSAANGGDFGTGADVLTINYPDPTITSVSPLEVGQGNTGTLTVNGTNFRTGFTLTAGTGITLSNLTYVSTTQVTASYSVAVAATLATRDVTYTQDVAGGGASATKTAAILVRPPEPTVTSVDAASWFPGQSNFTVRVVGTGFVSGTTVTCSGSGVTITNLSSGSPDTDMTLRVSVASNAALGARNITITPGSSGGPARTFNSLVTIIPADPIINSFSHPSLAQGASTVTVTVTGQNFRSGDVLSASGTGVTFGATTLSGTTTLTATATVSAGAATGARSLTVTHPTSEGGRSATLASAFSVAAATPTVTSMNPSALGVTASGGPTRVFPVTITGTNFMTGATLSVTKTSGTGIGVVTGSEVVVSPTTMTASLSVASSATIGAWDLTVTNPGTLGNSGTSGRSLLTVNASSTRTVNGVVASSGSTYGGERVTIYGSGFSATDTVDFGSVRATGTQYIDTNTFVATVPPPASASRNAATSVSVTVASAAAGSATLTNAYSYARDDNRFFVKTVWPAQGATNLPGNLSRTALLLSVPADQTTGTHGTTLTTNSVWFQNAGAAASTARSFGPRGRWIVLHRTGGAGPLATATYVLNLPTALTSLGGNPLSPVRLGAQSPTDQYTFNITSTTTDNTPPTLSTVTPANRASGVSRTAPITLVFSEEIDPLTVTGTNITLMAGTTPVPCAIDLASDLKTVTITPESMLVANTGHTITIATGVADMCSNAFASQTSTTFTTVSTSDTVAPVVDRVIIENLPSDLDGSGTYVNSGGTGNNAFDVFVPRNGFLLDVRFSDDQSGVDLAKFTAKCSVAVGANAANAELASNFTITGTGATWRIPSGTDIAAGENVTFTFGITDLAGNASSSVVVTLDVIDKNTTCTGNGTTGHSGGDHDPLDGRQTWLLRTDFDAYSVTYSGSGATSGATTTVAADNASDFDQALRYIGLGTGSMTSDAAKTVGYGATGTNDIVRRLVVSRVRDLMRARFGIGQDGTRTADSVDIEFLLPGEQGSLTSLPTFSSSNSASSANAYSEITIGGTHGAEATATTTSGTIGQAYFDERNLYQEANLNTGVASKTTGVYLLGMFKSQIGSASSTTWREKILNKFTAGFSGAVPVGESSDDDEVLAGTFDRTASGNTTAQNARYDAIMDAVEVVALYATAVAAHEVGHSTGLVADGAPKTGLFGNAHYNNTFTEATSVVPNTSGHLDAVGNDIMAASTSIETSVLTGSDFKRFSAMDIAHLLNRLFFDEGR